MNTMDKKVAMCNQLNMDFEEANELFGEESLESMQMARVNGGFAVVGGVGEILAALRGLSAVISCIEFLTSTISISPGGPTIQTSTAEGVIRAISVDITKALANKQAEIEVGIDSLVNNNLYGLTLKIKLSIPTPAE